MSLAQARRWLGVLAGLAVAAVSVYAVLMLEFMAVDQPGVPGFARVAIGLESRDAYLAATLRAPDGGSDLWAVYGAIDATLPHNARIIFYGETRGFYCPRAYMWGGWGAVHHEMIDYQDMRGPRDLIRRYRQLGVTHVLINQRRYELEYAADGPKARQLVAQAITDGRLREVLHVSSYSVYAVRGGDG